MKKYKKADDCLPEKINFLVIKTRKFFVVLNKNSLSHCQEKLWCLIIEVLIILEIRWRK